MLALQKNGKTVREYRTSYELADELESVITARDSSYYTKAKACLRQNAFALAIKGAKITLGGGWRFINLGEDMPLGEVPIARV